jgi:transposase
MKRPHRNHSAAFKAKVALTAIKGEHTAHAGATGRALDVHTSRITQWKHELLQRAVEVFASADKPAPAPDLKALHATIGQQGLGDRFFGRGARLRQRCERKR